MQVSAVGIGTWQLGGEWGQNFTQTEVDAIIGEAREQGINLIDTAECYGDHLSEKLIGRAIAHDRGKWIVATKFGHKFHGLHNRTGHSSPKEILTQLEDSLKALRTDFVDLYQYHSMEDSEFFREDLIATLHQARDSGKIRHLGNAVGSNRNRKQVKASKEMGVEAIQVVYNRLDRGPEESGIFTVCRDQNLGVLARVPLASGFLSGKYRPDHSFSTDDVRARWSQDSRAARVKEVLEIQREEVPQDIPMAQWALAWCLRVPEVTSVIPGCRSPSQVVSNAAAAKLSLDFS